VALEHEERKAKILAEEEAKRKVRGGRVRQRGNISTPNPGLILVSTLTKIDLEPAPET